VTLQENEGGWELFGMRLNYWGAVQGLWSGGHAKEY